MRTIKKYLLNTSPFVYFILRDLYQWFPRLVNGDVKKIVNESLTCKSKEDLFNFANQYIKAHQIPYEIFGLIDSFKKLAPKKFIEIGTADGGTHFLIRRLCPSITDSVAIDTDIRNKYLIDRLTKTSHSHYLRGFSSSPQVLAKLESVFPEPSSVDVLFIDGDHSYDGVKSDFDRYKHYVRSGGYIVFHDIVLDWNQRYGRNTNKYTGGVPRFFSEIKENYEHLTFVENPEQDGYGIGVIIQS